MPVAVPMGREPSLLFVAPLFVRLLFGALLFGALLFGAMVPLVGCDGGVGDPPEDELCTEDSDGDGLTDCAERDEHGTDPQLADTDEDGLSDGDEVDVHGTDPGASNTDGDAFTDSEEIECGSDPADTEEGCYACGWRHGDPGDLVPTGATVGDTIANVDFIDPCGETVPLWDFAGEYHILFMTAAW